MRERHIEYLACPGCRSVLLLKDASAATGERIETGTLGCSGCGATHPIVAFIPRFVGSESYAANFGFQWNAYTDTQIDSRLGQPMSDERFYGTTDWPREMEGELILEAGSGAGRFTEVMLASGATVVSFDLSSAVEANYRVNGSSPRCLIVQAGILSPPFREGIFDRVLCMGVLQHTPSPEESFRSLPRFAKPGGAIAIDIYRKRGPIRWLLSSRRMRWFTRYLPVRTVHALSKAYVDAFYPLAKALWKLGKPGTWVARYILLMKDRFWRKGFEATDEMQKESLILHFIDQLSSYHDKPQSVATVQRWFESEGIQQSAVFKDRNRVIGRGRRSG
jgi:SAM-dependent methyltransferase